jgi:hypothetical protein
LVANADLPKEQAIEQGVLQTFVQMLSLDDTRMYAEAIAAIGCLAMHKQGMCIDSG